MNVAKRRYWKAACWETRTCSLGEGSRKSTTHQWQLVGFLSYITSIRLRGGWMYLVAILDWYSRYVVSWLRHEVACVAVETGEQDSTWCSPTSTLPKPAPAAIRGWEAFGTM